MHVKKILAASLGLTLAKETAPVHASAFTVQNGVEVFGEGTISTNEPTLFRGAFSPDGSLFYFFRKVSQRGEDYRIFVSRRNAAGSWREPVQLSLGGDSHSDLYPTVSPDGRLLVFSSYRPVDGDSGNANLWVSRHTANGWGEPQPLQQLSIPANYDAGPWFDAEGNLHWASTSPDWTTTTKLVAARTGDGFAAPVEDTYQAQWNDWRDGYLVWRSTPGPDDSFAILDVRELREDGRPLPGDLWVTYRDGNGWTEPVRLGSDINTPHTYENFVTFSPDGESMFFVRGFETYLRVPVREIEAMR